MSAPDPTSARGDLLRRPELGSPFREILQALLAVPPDGSALAGWRPSGGDLGRQVAEWWAYLGDILGFYNHQIAADTYIDTAALDTVPRILDLVGPRPQPGTAAYGWIAAMLRPQPGTEPVVVPAGTPIASVPTPQLPSQVFETFEEVECSGPSTLDLQLVGPCEDLALGDAALPLLAGAVSGLSAGDLVLVAWQPSSPSPERRIPSSSNGPSSSSTSGKRWAAGTLLMLVPERDPYGEVNTRVVLGGLEWAGPAPTSAPAGQCQLITAGAVAPLAAFHEDALRSYEVSAFGGGGFDGGREAIVHLATVIGGLQLGDTVALTTSGGTPVRPIAVGVVSQLDQHVSAVRPDDGSAARSGAALLVPHTIVTFAVEDADMTALGSPPPNIVLRHQTSVLGTPIPTPSAELRSLPASVDVRGAIPTPQQGGGADAANELPVAQLRAKDGAPLVLKWVRSVRKAASAVTTTAASGGSARVGSVRGSDDPVWRLALVRSNANDGEGTLGETAPVGLALLEDAAGRGVLVRVTTTAQHLSLELADAKDVTALPLVAPLRLLLHLLPVRAGTTVTGEILGDGNAAVVNQSFRLAHGPLLYDLVEGAPLSSLRIEVNGIRWGEVGSLEEQPDSAKVYTVSMFEDAVAITFGDGTLGQRLPTGRHNIVASYRYGPLVQQPPPGHLTNILRPQAGLSAVRNPGLLTGGQPPPNPSELRISAPRQRRLIGASPATVRECEAWAEQFTSGSAQACWDGEHLVVYATGGKATFSSEQPHNFRLRPATPVDVTVECTVVVGSGGTPANATVLAAVKKEAQRAILRLFADLMIGQNVDDDDVYAALATIGQVVGVQNLRLTLTRDGTSIPAARQREPGEYLTLTHLPDIAAVVEEIQ